MKGKMEKVKPRKEKSDADERACKCVTCVGERVACGVLTDLVFREDFEPALTFVVAANLMKLAIQRFPELEQSSFLLKGIIPNDDPPMEVH